MSHSIYIIGTPCAIITPARLIWIVAEHKLRLGPVQCRLGGENREGKGKVAAHVLDGIGNWVIITKGCRNLSIVLFLILFFSTKFNAEA